MKQYRIISIDHQHYFKYVLQVKCKVWFGLLGSRYEHLETFNSLEDAEDHVKWLSKTDKVKVIKEYEV